jgi:hypothetical protein
MLADTLLINGKCYTLDEACPRASQVALSEGRVLAVGEDLSALWASNSQIIDLDGRCVIPGLTDSHIHFTWYALTLRQLDLSGADTLSEMVQLVAKRARETPPDRWIVGHRWDQERWPERRFPTAADLDAVAADHPVLLRAKNGHALVVNSRVLRQAGITAETPDPPGGRIGRREDGSPNGMLFEDSAMRLAADLVPPPRPSELDHALEAAFPRAWQVGLTAVHDVDTIAAFSAYQRLRARGALGLRVVKYLPAEQLDCALALGLRPGLGDDRLRIGGIKVFTDGALGAHTAAMLEPYEGASPGGTGVLTMEPEAFRALARKAIAGGWPLAVHAIGDRANRLVLDTLAELGPGDLRHRIEHVQLLHPDDVPRLATLGVIASMQPIHATQDYEMAERYWGTRCETAYAWRSLWETGATLAFGSDAPVEDLNPLVGIHAAVTRRCADGAPGPEGWYPEQRLTVDQAVRAYTWGAAYAGGLEERLGSLSPGKWADLVVLDRDIFTVDPMEIVDTQVRATMVAGELVYDAL